MKTNVEQAIELLEIAVKTGRIRDARLTIYVNSSASYDVSIKDIVLQKDLARLPDGQRP